MRWRTVAFVTRGYRWQDWNKFWTKQECTEIISGGYRITTPCTLYLQHDIQTQIGGASGHSNYRVFKLNGSNDVYRYEDRKTGTNFIAQHSTHFTRGLPNEKLEQLPRLLAQMHRAASRFRLQLYPGVEDTIRYFANQ